MGNRKSTFVSFDYLYLILIITTTLVAGVYFGNRLHVQESFTSMDHVNNTVGDIMHIRTIDDAKKLTRRNTNQLTRAAKGVINGFNLFQV
jgi:hypothetical protein